MCTLYQKVYDRTYEHLLKKIGKKLFQPPDDREEVPSEQVSMLLQGYSLLISACEIEDEIPDDIKVNYLISDAFVYLYIIIMVEVNGAVGRIWSL